MNEKEKTLLLLQSREGLAILLSLTTRELTFIAHKIQSNRYKEFEIKKRKGGKRIISSPTKVLKDTQRKLLTLLEPFYPEPICSNGFVSKRNILTNSSQHIKKCCVLNIDLEDFFPSINFGRVYALFRARPFNLNEHVASTIAALVCDKNALPQGAPTSPLISNMICYGMDKELMRFAKKNNISYSRYADDISFSTSKKDFSKDLILSEPHAELTVGHELQKILNGHGFKINNKKTRLYRATKAKYITGIKVNDKQNLDRRFIRNVRTALNKLEKNPFDEVNEQFNKTYNFRSKNKNLLSTLRGRIEHIRNVKGHFDPVFRRLWNRFIVIENKGSLHLAVDELEQLYNKIFIVKGREQGSGFIVGKHLITCKHVVVTRSKNTDDTERLNDDPLSEISFFTYENYGNSTQLKAANPKIIPELDMVAYDYTNLHTSHEEHKFLIGDSNTITIGQGLSAFGFANYRPGLKSEYIETKVASTEKNKYGMMEFNLDRPLYGGMSGGPILNSKKELVGVIVRGVKMRELNRYEFVSTFLPINEVWKIVNKEE